MLERVPLALLVDDSCPLIHVYRNHWVDVHKRPPLTEDGRPLAEYIPNSFLDHFCDVVEHHGMAGKFSIVPAPALLGNVVQGIQGFDRAETVAWIDTVRTRLHGRFDFCPEGLTHNLAVDIETNSLLSQGEAEWSQSQTRHTLVPYLARQLTLLRDAGIESTGFTSCWLFGQQVEAEYLVSMVEALRLIYGHTFSWYFLHIWHAFPATRPYIAYAAGDTTLVAINSTVDDLFWTTINDPRTDRAYISSVTDELLSVDGKAGAIRDVLTAGGWPIIMTHWQSLFSNGLETGLAVLDELGKRVAGTLSDEVEWTGCLSIARQSVASWESLAQRSPYA